MASERWRDAVEALLNNARDEVGADGLLLIDPREIPRSPHLGYLGISGALDNSALFAAANKWRSALDGTYVAENDGRSAVMVSIVCERAILVATFPIGVVPNRVLAAVERPALKALLESYLEPFPPGYLTGLT